MEIFSLENEKQVISGLIQSKGTWFYEVDKFLSENDFYLESHQTIFSVICQLLNNKETVDKVIVAQKIHDIGIKLEINPFEYLRALNVISITQEGFVQSVKELKKLSVRRDISKTASKIGAAMKSCHDASYDQIIAKAESIFSETINVYENSNEPVDLFKDLETIIEELGNTPIEEIGLKTPYPLYNKIFGGLIPGDLYIFMAYAKVGKTTFLNDLLWKTCTSANPGKKVRALCIDTEMESDRIRTRNVASLSGVNEWLIKTGNFRKNPELLAKVRAIWPLVKSYEEKVDHIYVGNMPIDEVCSIARRWHHKKVAQDEQAVLCYDYIKLTGETINEVTKEYAVIGSKTDQIKKLGSELGAPVIAAVQTNAQGGVSQSQRISWFCSALFALQKKDPSDITKYGRKWGSHCLIPKFTRNLGQYGDLASNIVTTIDEKGDKKYTEDYINLNIENFNVSERGMFSDTVGQKVKAVDDSPEDSGLL